MYRMTNISTSILVFPRIDGKDSLTVEVGESVSIFIISPGIRSAVTKGWVRITGIDSLYGDVIYSSQVLNDSNSAGFSVSDSLDTKENVSNKALPNGYAPLDLNKRILDEHIQYISGGEASSDG